MRRREFLVALAAATLTCVAAEPASKAFELAIAKGRVDAAQETVRVKKGDKVELRWTSDRRIALHLHGYDIEATVTPEAPAVMSFQARIAGRFPVSEHGHGSRHERALLYLEVLP
jgi:FtsP/CotA-like multicopper oxidase with cupredoxin domain